MSINSNILFYLSKGNPFNSSCGMSIDQNFFGKSLGGEILTSQKFLNGQIINCNLNYKTYNIFDTISSTDIIKDNINYRSIFIKNTSTSNIILDTITSEMVNNNNGIYFSDIEIAFDGVYTIGEVSRPIPTKSISQPGNPSIYLEDEYDSTGKLNLNFKTNLDSTDLPTELLPNTCIKLWIKRTLILNKTEAPDGDFVESFIITINEYDNGNSTPIEIVYEKLDGRIPLANWYDYTITSGKGSKIILKELFPKEVDLSFINIVNTFVKEDKIIIFYYTETQNIKNYFLLTVKPDDISKYNKFIQINLNIPENILDTESIISKDIMGIYKSYYNIDDYIIFWKEKIHTTDVNFFGSENTYERITVDVLHTNIWTNSVTFDSIYVGYNNRHILNFNLDNNKIIRKYVEGINLSQFDDLFILFTRDTKNSLIVNISDINLNKNQLLYVFEKDIISNKFNKFKHFPGDSSQVLSHRLFPTTLLTDQRLTAFNNVKNSINSIIISDTKNVDSDVESLRTIKSLLDGTRYVDLNSIHTKEFKVKKSFITYELDNNNTNLNNLLFTTDISIDNDENVYENKLTYFSLSNTINNMPNGIPYDRPWFQQNIIDDSKSNSLSIPIEWADRTYKDEWITIASTLPATSNSQISFKYNFNKNLWKVAYYDKNNIEYDSVYDSFNDTYYNTNSSGSTGSTGTTGTSSEPLGKTYKNLQIDDLPYILEPGTYQPFSIKLYFKNIGPDDYLVNYKFYFKGNITPIFDIQTRVTSITYLSYILINPNKTFNMKINYLEVLNSSTSQNLYYIKNTHNAFLNNLNIDIGSELQVNKQIFQNQTQFKYYRIMNIYGIDNSINDLNRDIVIPIILYGNGYKTDNPKLYLNTLTVDQFNTLTVDDFNTLRLNKNYKLSQDYPFDFSKMNINDKNLRLYSDSNFSNPINFKINTFEYSKDYVVLWIKLTNYVPNTKIYLFYGCAESAKSKTEYIKLKKNLFNSPSNLGTWSFESILYDERLSYNTGKIFNVGEPMIYEKTSNGDLRLTKIEKEYMYGIAKVYKSHKFDMEIDTPAEESLFFDENVKTQFIDFIKQTANVLKPSYTYINDIRQFGFDIIESGSTAGGNMGQTNNTRMTGLVSLTPNSNVNTYYERKDDNRFNLLTSFNGFSKDIDWIISKTMDTSLFKSGSLKVNGKVKSETIKFKTPFKNSDYFIVLSNPANQKVYWQLVCNNKFTITCSNYLVKEVCWMAFHRDIFGGVYTPNSIYVGKRVITGSVETTQGESPTTANMPVWYNNELLVKPEITVDGDSGIMNMDMDIGYSLILSSDENINIYWNEKESNQFRIKTSSPTPCTIHWVAIKKGIEWWQELN